jgi:hypothetical protein
MGESWASLGARVLTRVNSILVKGWHELVQGGERETFDTVWHAGDDQVRGWHDEAMPCHGMACLRLFNPNLGQCKWW